ncbi:MAG TPA: aldo/keto reductase [Solirubrobacteraceae bacterium]|nr:aldo/keto reductase [Solirubrobacteraceae bacterium]
MTTRVVIETRTVGRSEVTAPRIALGCGNFGGVGSQPEFFGQGLDEAQAFAVMDAAWDLGISHFDTADAYGGGRSETTIGNWIRARGRSPLLTTKTFNPMDADGDHGVAPARMTRQLHSSLERLGVEQIDVYLTHDFDPDVAATAVVDTLEHFRSQGLIRATGVSNYDATQLQATLAEGHVDAIQNSYSLLVRGDEAELLPLCAGEQVSYSVYSPLAGGWLTGKYRRGVPFPAGSRMTQRPDGYAAFVSDRVFDGLERLEEIAAERGTSMAGLALSWLLANPGVDSVVVGPMHPRHLDPIREALAKPLAPNEHEALGKLF